jgi:acetyltransferase
LSSLNSLFAPKSVAVVGASRRDGTLGKMFVDTLVGMNYKGRIYPINPKANEIDGLRCFPDIGSIPEIPDLAIVLLPKEMVFTAIEALAQKKVKNVVVISAGFKEVGEEGKKREEALINLIHKNDMRMVGPNSMGLFNTNPELSLNATFSPTSPIPGHVGFISQSGALGVAVLELSQKIGLGFSSFVSTGNKADIGDVDCLRFMSEDDNTKVIILYQESIDHPEKFRKLCKEIIPNKPVLSLKAGRTRSGLKAAQSHTGALASDDVITDAFMKQCGILRCETLQELLDSALAFTSQPLPAGKKVGVVTNAGGPGILVSDALEKYGLILASLSENTISALGKILPPEAGLNNPVDMIASATHKTYRDVCQILEKEPTVDSIIVIIVKPPVDTTPKKIISELNSIIDRSKKPFFFTLMAGEITEKGKELFKETSVPVFSYPESTACALGKMVRYIEIRDQFKQSRKKTGDIISNSQTGTKSKRQASIDEIIPILEKYNLKVCDFVLVDKVEKAIDFHQKAGRIALKIANEEIIHKSDEGLVKLNLSSPKEIEDAFKEIKIKVSNILPLSVTPRFLVQEMVSEGIELVLGAKRDPLFGSVVMFGIGGVFIELYKDVVFRVTPLDESTIKLMIEELKGKNILEGFRNFPPINKKVLIETILNFSKLVSEHPEIVEIELNPIIWSSENDQPIIVDSRCTLVSQKAK